MSIAPAFADEQVYQFQPLGFNRPRQERIRLPHAIHFPDIQAFLMGKLSDRFVVTQPIEILIEREDDGSYVVSDDIFLVYGDGNTESDAVKDYVQSLVNFFEIIEDGAETNEFDKAQLVKLQSYIQRRGRDAVQADRS